MNLHEVVDHEVEADRVHVILQLLAESIGQSREAAHTHRVASVEKEKPARGGSETLGRCLDAFRRKAMIMARSEAMLIVK